jgi:cell fate regulator YaaT (PSP1 superfamily)
MRFLGEYDPAGEAGYSRGNQVIVRSERGLEAGEILCEASAQAATLLTEPTHGQIVRVLTPDDRQQVDRLREREQAELDTCCRIVQERQLPMELVDVEHLFGGERIIFYF